MNMQHLVKIGGIVREVGFSNTAQVTAGKGKLFAYVSGNKEVVKHVITGRFIALRTIKK